MKQSHMMRLTAAFLLFLFLTVGLLSPARAESNSSPRPQTPSIPGATGISQYESATIGPADMQRLQKGEVIISEKTEKVKTDGKTESSPRYVVAKLLVNAPPTKLWELFQNQEAMFKGEPHMKKVKTVSRPSPTLANVEYSLMMTHLLPLFTYTTKINFHQPTYMARFNRTSGSFKDFQGFCKLSPVEGGKKTLMIYALNLDVGFFVPQMVVRSVLKNELPTLMTHIRNKAEGQ